VFAAKSVGGSDSGTAIRIHEKTGGIAEPSFPATSSQTTGQSNTSSTNGWGNLFASDAG